MHKRLICLVMPAIMLFMYDNAGAQSYCPNVDFTSGDFTNWEGYYGDYENPEITEGFANRRHTIITDTVGKDPHSCGGLSMVPPRAKISARLGNASTLSEAEQLRYTFEVTNENNLFIYEYAVVLQDPGHPPEHQPDFTIEVRDQQGVLIDPLCGYYYVFAQPQLPGWHTCLEDTPVIWKDWTTVALDLSAMMGDTVTIVFTTRDCQEGAHFGYAYISAHCSSLQLTVGYCTEKDYVTVTAPPGFTYSWNTGQTTQSIVLTDPLPGMMVQCTLTAANGCQATIQTLVQPTFVSPGFSYEQKCSREPVQFRDTTTVNQNYIANWVWDFGDGSPVVRGTPEPVHVFAEGGDYNVTLELMTSDSCISTVNQTVNVLPNVVTDLGTERWVKKGQTIWLDAGNPGAEYLWSTGETSQQIEVGSDNQVIWVRITMGQCIDSDTVLIRTLFGCTAELPNAFSPNGDGQNDILYIYTLEVGTFELMIFDRSGEMVFSTTDAGTGWNGIYRGQELGIGVYNYLLKGRCSDNTEFTKKGNITLLR